MNPCTWYKSHVNKKEPTTLYANVIITVVCTVHSTFLYVWQFHFSTMSCPKQWLCNLFLLRQRFRAAISDATCSCLLQLPNFFPTPCRYLALLILCRVTKGYNTSRLTLGKVASSSRHWHTDKNRGGWESEKKKYISTFATMGNWKPWLTLVIILWEEVGAPRGRARQTRG